LFCVYHFFLIFPSPPSPRSGKTPLIYAAGDGKLEACKFLISQKADVNAADTMYHAYP
jgi:hypothetical protein